MHKQCVTYVYLHKHRCIHTHSHSFIVLCTYTRTHTHTQHTYTPIHAHTYTHAHTFCQIYSSPSHSLHFAKQSELHLYRISSPEYPPLAVSTPPHDSKTSSVQHIIYKLKAYVHKAYVHTHTHPDITVPVD